MKVIWDKEKIEEAHAYDSEDEIGLENLGVIRLIIQYVYNKGKLLADEQK